MTTKIFYQIAIVLTLIIYTFQGEAVARTLHVGYYDNPLLFSTSNERIAEGFVVDVLEDIADKEGWIINWHYYPFEDMLKIREIDLYIGLVKTEDRVDNFKYCKESVFVNWATIFQYEDENISNLRDLEGKTIGMIGGSIYTIMVKEMLSELKINCFVEEVDHNDILVEQLKRGEINACLINRTVMFKMDTIEQIKSTGIIFDPMKHYIAGNKKIEDAILEKIDNHLARMKDDFQSIYYKSQSKWFGENIIHVRGKKEDKVLVVVLAVIVLILLIFIFYILRKMKMNRIKYRLDSMKSDELNEMYQTSIKEKDQILDVFDDVIVYVRPDRSIGWVNEAGRKLFGLKPGAVLDDYCAHMLAGEDQYCDKCPVTMSINQKQRVVDEVFFENLNKTFRIDVAPLFDEEGKFTGVVEQLKDVTLEIIKRDEDRKELQLLNGLFDNTSIGFIFTDSNKKILRINEFAMRLFGYSQKDSLLGNESDKITEIFNIEDFKNSSRIHQDLDEIEVVEKSFVNKKGENILVLCSTLPIIVQEQEFRVETYIDISHFKEIENNLVESRNQIKEGDLLKTRFITNMSYKFKDLLNQSLRDLNQLKKSSLFTSDNFGNIDSIFSNINWIISLTSNVIDMSLIEKEEFEVYIASVDIAKLTSSIFKDFKKLHEVSGESNVEFRFKPELGIKSLHVLSDEIRLTQILKNLLNNALEFTESGFVEFGYKKVGSNLRIYVQDSGVGIPKDKRRKIFEPFYQAQKMQNEEYNRAGVGLAISWQLASVLGVKIKLDSEEGKGSTFWIEINKELIIPAQFND